MTATADFEAFAAFEKAGWEARGAAYRDHFAAVTARLGPALLDAATVGADTRMLDVGCGSGEILGQARARGATVTGCDAATSMVALARRAHPGVELAVADAGALPHPSQTFDAVVANAVFLHLAWPEAAAREAARVLAPGGRLALTVYAAPARARLVGVFLEAAAEVGPRPVTSMPPGPDMFRFSSHAELTTLLTEAGLVDVHVAEVAFDQPFPDANALWAALTNGTVRAAALIAGQPDDITAAIRRAFDERVEPYRTEAGLMVPTAFVLAAAAAPEARR